MFSRYQLILRLKFEVPGTKGARERARVSSAGRFGLPKSLADLDVLDRFIAQPYFPLSVLLLGITGTLVFRVPSRFFTIVVPRER